MKPISQMRHSESPSQEVALGPSGRKHGQRPCFSDMWGNMFVELLGEESL